MAFLPKPNKPLRILTIDGGGLDPVSTAMILQRTLDVIARNNEVPDSNPRPCDVFDVIAGVGPGGWLALLLGRFQLDVEGAMARFYDLKDFIKPPSMFESLRVNLLHHCYYDNDGLVERIDELTEIYQTDKHMFFTAPEGTRCKHVFVSALKNYKGGQHEFNLFRTYDRPKGSNVLGGPENPHEYKISHAFRATGAPRYFTPLWTAPTAKWSDFEPLEIPPPAHHNLTELALNEVWGLYGKDVEMSVVLSIGSAIPNASNSTMSLVGPHSVSNGDAGIEEKLSRDENNKESDIEEKLRNVYPEHTPPYYRLLPAPARSFPKTAQNNISALEYTEQYLRTHSVKVVMEEIGQRIHLGT